MAKPQRGVPGRRELAPSGPLGRAPGPLRFLLPKAVDVLERSLDENGKPSRDAAVQIPKACRLSSRPPPTGFTTAEDIDIARREADGARHRRLMFADP